MNENQPKYMQDREPDLTVKFYLVPHGYQASFYDNQGNLMLETLRDFAESRPVKFWVHNLTRLILQTLQELRDPDFIRRLSNGKEAVPGSKEGEVPNLWRKGPRRLQEREGPEVL